MTFSIWKGLFSITSATPVGGPAVVLGLTTTDTTFNAHVGDVLVLRDGSQPGLVFAITSINGLNVIASRLGSTLPDVEEGVTVEAGPLFTADYGNIIEVTEGGVNNGIYYVDRQSAGIDLVLQGVLPRAAENGQPVVLGLVSLSFERLVISSKLPTTASYVFLREENPLLTTTGSNQAFMSTPWMLLPEVPQNLSPDDILELYRTNYVEVTASYDILDVDKNNKIIQVEPDITPELLSYTFSENTTVPFARLRAGHVIDFSAFSAKLRVWALEDPGAKFFSDLNRFIHPLLANKHPTAAMVSDGRTLLLSLAALLTFNGAKAVDPSSTGEFTLEALLGTYSVDPVPQVDTLLHSYIERGLDKAVDTLYAAQFSAFFQLDVDTSSYVGDVQAKIRDVARKDLPVSKVDRPDTTSAQVQQSSADTDFEYEHTDGTG